jgi:hypothetical protein
VLYLVLGLTVNREGKIVSQGNYEGISIREAMEKINAKNNGWYLPNIQRLYVWGSRDSSEDYICLLVDSLMRGYPIGGLVLWETDAEVPFREFLGDFQVGKTTRVVAEDRWSAHKYLVYDGQQRLQTLYTVLYNRFNGRVLCYDLTFKQADHELDETGFCFKDICDDDYANCFISMVKLMTMATKDPNYKFILQDEYIKNKTPDVAMTIRGNIDRLWDVFIKTDTKSIAYFPVQSSDVKAVDEVFRRLNSGGVSLTQLELVLSKLKSKSPYFEERLWDLSKTIKTSTGGTPGIEFTSHAIVQLLYLLVFQTTRVDESRVTDDNTKELIENFTIVADVLPVVFKDFFYEPFHINSNMLIWRFQAILPILVYFIELKKKGMKWQPSQIKCTKAIQKYFIKSQLCDWNTQTMVTRFSREAILAADNNDDFPLEKITSIAVEKNRTAEIFFYQLESWVWFSLKILTPSRLYLFMNSMPQVDHIFPLAMKQNTPENEAYRQKVDVLWNKQPAPAGVNNFKRCKPPLDYFSSDEGSPFTVSYDFLPEGLDSDAWENEDTFIAFRKEKMLTFLKDHYDIEIKDNPTELVN